MQLDFLILADRAEAVNGKLYLLGGGWDRLGLTSLPGHAFFDVAMGVLIEYLETNERHSFSISLEDEDNRVVLGPITGQVEAGRPPGMRPGQLQRFMLAVRGPFLIPHAGAFSWAVALDGNRVHETRFWVEQVQLAAPSAPAR